MPLQHHFCHTHTTVTVIGGTAKQLLGSSTDWCATIIVTPHTRVVPLLHTHTHGWESGVVWSMCCECCVHQHLDGHFTLPHNLCVSPHQSSVCHHPFHHPFAFLSHTPFGVCVALSSGIHALFVGVDVLVLASVPLIWDTPCLPSITACV